MWRLRRRRRITGRSKVACAGLAGLALLAYANAFASGFVFDNAVIILEDPRLREASLAHVREIFTHSYWWPYADSALYRPLTTLSYLLNYSVLGNGDRPAGYHAVNLLLHIANASLLVVIVERLTKRFFTVVLAVALWTVHPILTEAVTNIIGRADVLSAFGILTSLLCHLRAGVGTRSAWRWRLGVAAGAAIAVFSKESGIAVIGVIALYDLLVAGRRDWRSIAAGWLPAVVPIGLFLLLRVPAIAGAAANDFPFVDNPIIGASFLTGRLTALAVAARYVGLIFWPLTLSADYSFPQIPLASGTAQEWAGWTLILLLLIAGAVLHRRARVATFALLTAALMFLPASNLIFATGTIMAERLMYLPAAGLVVVFVFVVLALAARFHALKIMVPAMVLMLAALTTRTVLRNRDWRNELTLWTATLAASPQSFKAHSGIAEAMYQADATRANLPAVIAEKERSLALLAQAPHPEAVIKPYRQAAAYHLERGEWLEQHGGAPDDITRSFTRAAELARRYLELLPASRALPNAPSARDESDVLGMLSLATARLSDTAAAVDTAQRSRAADPFSAIRYRGEAAALLAARRNDDAAVALMTGFMVTGDQNLRGVLVDLYRGGLDAQGCAISGAANGGVNLNTSCAIVKRHMCAASAETATLQRQRGRSDLAEAVLSAVSRLDCASLPAR